MTTPETPKLTKRQQWIAEFKADIEMNPSPPMGDLEGYAPEMLMVMATALIPSMIVSLVEIERYDLAKVQSDNLVLVREFIDAKQAACDCAGCTENRRLEAETLAAIDKARAAGKTPMVNASGQTLQ